MAEQQQASLVGPLEVVEDQDDGLVFRGHGQQAHHGGKEQEPLGVGIGGLARRQVRDPAVQCRDQRQSSDPWASTWAASCSSGAWVT